MKLTNYQKSRALSLVAGFIVEGIPGFVTPREASDLCARFGVTNDRFRRIAKRDQNFRPIGIAAVAVEIAKKETQLNKALGGFGCARCKNDAIVVTEYGETLCHACDQQRRTIADDYEGCRA